MRFARDSSFPAGEIKRHNFVAKISIASHGPSSRRFRIVWMGSSNYDLQPARSRRLRDPFGEQG